MVNAFYGLAAISIAAGLFFIFRGFGEDQFALWLAWQTGVSAVLGGLIFGAIGYGLSLLEIVVVNTRPTSRKEEVATPRQSFHEELRGPVVALRALAETGGTASSLQYGAIVTFLQTANGADYSADQRGDLTRWAATLPGDKQSVEVAIRSLSGLSTKVKGALGQAVGQVIASKAIYPGQKTAPQEDALKLKITSALQESPLDGFL